jgi:tRNA A58 N-methylase Trm61
MVSFLEQRLTKDLSLFEFGSGNSTLFFADRVKVVVSVEDDRTWYSYCVDRLPANVTLIFREWDHTGTYARSIAEQERNFDVVVVDGEDRVNCLITAQQFLTPSGVIILDDTQNTTSNAGIDSLLERGFRRLDLEGVKPGGIRFYRTTILYRDGNCLEI